MNSTQSKPLVSVLVMTYNHEKFISQALDGILMQQVNFNYEIVLGEDCSTDRTREIVVEYAERHPGKFVLLLHEKNIGAMANQMAVLKACTGKYIALCEGDDYWTDPLKLQKQVDFLESSSEYVICFHEVSILKDNNIIPDFLTRKVHTTTQIDDLLDGNYMHTPSVVFRNYFKKDQIPKFFYLSPIGDFLLHIYIAQYGKIYKFNEVMAIYRYGGYWSGNDEKQKQILSLKSLRIAAYGFNHYPKLFEKWYEKLLWLGLSDNRNEVFYETDFEKKLLHAYDPRLLSSTVHFKVLLKALGYKLLNKLRFR